MNTSAAIVAAVVALLAVGGGSAYFLLSGNGDGNDEPSFGYGEGFSLTATAYGYKIDDGMSYSDAKQTVKWTIDFKTTEYTEDLLKMEICFHQGSKNYLATATIEKQNDTRYVEKISIFKDNTYVYQYLESKSQWCMIGDDGTISEYGYGPSDPDHNMFYFLAELTINGFLLTNYGPYSVDLDKLFEVDKNWADRYIITQIRAPRALEVKSYVFHEGKTYDYAIINSNGSIVRSNNSDIFDSATGSYPQWMYTLTTTIGNKDYDIYNNGFLLGPTYEMFNVSHEPDHNLIYSVTEVEYEQSVMDKLDNGEAVSYPQVLHPLEEFPLVEVNSIHFSDKQS